MRTPQRNSFSSLVCKAGLTGPLVQTVPVAKFHTCPLSDARKTEIHEEWLQSFEALEGMEQVRTGLRDYFVPKHQR